MTACPALNQYTQSAREGTRTRANGREFWSYEEQRIPTMASPRWRVLHTDALTYFQRKASDSDRWLAGMRRVDAAQ